MMKDLCAQVKKFKDDQRFQRVYGYLPTKRYINKFMGANDYSVGVCFSASSMRVKV